MTSVDVLVILFGLAIGSFLNVCIYRLPRGTSVVRPRSRCNSCRRPVKAWENIPLLSYLLLRGRCRGCGNPIGWSYPVVELLAAGSGYLLYLKFGLSWTFALNVLFFAALIVLVFVDLFERILPDVLTLSGAFVGVLSAPLQAPEFLGGATTWHSFGQSILGALLGGGLLWLVATLYLKLRKIEGMGLGDIKLMLMVGAFLGWKSAWMTIFLGSLAGAVVGTGFICIFRKNLRYQLPFGSFLGLAAMVTTLWGQDLLGWYLGWL